MIASMDSRLIEDVISAISRLRVVAHSHSQLNILCVRVYMSVCVCVRLCAHGQSGSEETPENPTKAIVNQPPSLAIEPDIQRAPCRGKCLVYPCHGGHV